MVEIFRDVDDAKRVARSHSRADTEKVTTVCNDFLWVVIGFNLCLES